MMSPLKSKKKRQDDRRCADRTWSDNPRMTAQVTGTLDQVMHPAGLLDLSRDGYGVCLVLEPRFPPGSRLFLEICNGRGLAVLWRWVEVKHSDICCPSSVEMYLHGCRLNEPLPTEKINPQL
jgi:hypothetical protein